MKFLSLLVLLSVASIYAQNTQDTAWASVPQRNGPALDSSVIFRVDSIEFETRNAFDDARTHMQADRAAYSILNKLHFITRESVIRKLLLFEEGDSVSMKELLESERLLRSQKIFADANIETRTGAKGERILHVVTSDNWTTTLPVSLGKPGEELVWSVGILENNVLGFGQSIGLYYGHEEERNSWMLQYGNPHLFFANNRLLASWSNTTDGYAGDFSLGRPFLSRARDEWSYSIQAMTQKLDRIKYWSTEELPANIVRLDSAEFADRYTSGDLSQIRVKEFEPGKDPFALGTWREVRDDSVHFDIGRSFGNGRKILMRATYDFRRTAWPKRPSERALYIYATEDYFWHLDTAQANMDEWLPREADSRPGVQISISRIRYMKLRNFHRIKWTEDVDKGWNLAGALSRNFEALGARDNRWFWTGSSAVAFGSMGLHHLLLKSYAESYLAEDDYTMEELYGRFNMEYIMKPSNRFSTVLGGQVDGYRNAPIGRQLYLGGFEGLNGLPSNLLAGQARFFGSLEQRWFPDIELGTVVPVFAAFVNAGQTFGNFEDFEPRDMNVIAGFGTRLGMSKSVDGVVNHINISWPLRGPLSGSKVPRFSIVATVSL